MKGTRRLLAGFLAAVLLTTSVGAVPFSQEQDTGYMAASAQNETMGTSIDMEVFQQTDDLFQFQQEEDRTVSEFVYEGSTYTAEELGGGKETFSLPAPGTFVEGRLLVKVRQEVSLFGEGSNIFNGIAAQTDYLFPAYDAVQNGDISLQSDEPEAAWYGIDLLETISIRDAWQQLLQDERVLHVEPSYLVKADSTVEITNEDPFQAAQRWHEQIGAEEAWELAENVSRQEVIIAVVDSGVDLDHPDLKDAILPGYDFVQHDNIPDDVRGHGTHVAGIAAARRNSIGVRGVAYDAKILPVRVLGDNGSGSTEDVASGIRWAADQGADVINLSLGSTSYNRMEDEAINYARSKGCLLVVSAGNDAVPTAYAGHRYCGDIYYPASHPGVFTVMASDLEPDNNGDWLATYSNYDTDPGTGVEYELMAPGSDIYSTAIGGGYCYMDGTSMSTPVVSGAAALLMSMGASATDAWDILISTAKAKQARTLHNGSVLSVPSLDLEAAVTMQRNSITRKEPIVANSYFYTEVNNINTNGTINLSTLSGGTGMFFYNNSLYSTPYMTFENLGGSGNVTITGTIGGVSIESTTVYVKAGEVVTVPVIPISTRSSQFTITNRKTLVSLYANGIQQLNGNVTAWELMPVSAQIPTGQVTGKVTLQPSTNCATSFIQDINLTITSTGSLTVAPNHTAQFFQAKNNSIRVNSTSNTDPSLLFVNVTALAPEQFHVSGNNNIAFGYCRIWDPDLYNVSLLYNCRFLGSGLSCYVDADEIENCGFADMKVSIYCTYFIGSMINRCYNSLLHISEGAQYNTFVENYTLWDPSDTLTIRAANALPNEPNRLVGLQNSVIVGPTNIRTLVDSNKASVHQLYIQAVYDEDFDYLNNAYTADFNKSGSTWYSSFYQFQQKVDTTLLPPFVVASSTWYPPSYPNLIECNSVPVTSGESSRYGLEFRFGMSFSKPVTIPETQYYSGPYIYSEYSEFADYAGYWVNNDGSITVQVFGKSNSDETRHDEFHVTNVYTDVWPYATELSAQSIDLITYWYFPSLDWINAEIENGKAIITWEDYRAMSSDSVEIFRTIDSGAEEKIATLADATAGTYTDTAVTPGHTYTYKVVIYGYNRYYSSTTCVYPKETSHGGEDFSLTAKNDGFSVGLNSPWHVRYDQTLQYTFPTSMAKYLQPSEALENSGLGYGALDNGDGTTTVYVGTPNDWSIMRANELFTISPPGVAMDWLYCISNTAVSVHNMDESAKLVLADFDHNDKMHNASVATVGAPVTAKKMTDHLTKIFFLHANNHTPIDTPVPVPVN